MSKKKTWVKPKEIIIDIGPCKYCGQEMQNIESFVSFLDKTKAHYKCMKNEEDKFESVLGV